MPETTPGTITFLFTDIEGSTRLWDEHPDAMRLALAYHDTLMRTAIEQHGGHVFKTIGDAFCAAFRTALDALQAALTAQQAFASESWPEPIKIKVRMALHTGAVEARDSDYFGQPLNRIARLLAVGHGGQVLISAAAQEMIRDALPPAVNLLSLGEHRLRDLNRPEAIFQLLHPDLPAEFPPLKSLDSRDLPNNLPLQLTSFIGREQEIEQIKALLEKSRLLTLAGSGGCGKTRLSLQVAADVLDQYPNGVWLVELAPLVDPSLVPQTIASALRLTEQAGKTVVQTLTDHLKSRRLLLVLDNCEHLLSACAQIADALLRACPDLSILASSREGLGITGEQTYRIPSLSLPDPKLTHTVEQVCHYEAVRLFVDRASFHQSGFTVTDQNASALASVCHRLDGIPLAIELAAARVRSLSVEEINTRLDNRFRLLTGGSKTAMPRQQTLRALIDWSYGLLNAQEKLLLVRLSTFSGGWTLQAAEQVCAGESGGGTGIEGWEVLDLLTNLVDKSLVVAEAQGQITRYRLLETVRQYARERLADSEEGEEVRIRHRDYFLTLAEEGKEKIHGPEQAHWIRVLEMEHDNLRQAISFCLEEAEGTEAGLRFGAALWGFWYMRLNLIEGRHLLEALLARSGRQVLSKTRADALNGAGLLAWTQGDYVAARPLHEESLAISQKIGDKSGIACSLVHLGAITFIEGDKESGRALTEESLAIFREIGETLGIGLSLHNLGNCAFALHDYALARARFEESLSVCRELGHPTWQAMNLNQLGNIAYDQGDYLSARALKEEALAIMREVGDKWGIEATLYGLGVLAANQGDFEVARTLFEEHLTIAQEMGDTQRTAASLNGLGLVALYQGDYDTARTLFEKRLGLSRELRKKIDIADSLNNRGTVALYQDDYIGAHALFEESLRIYRELGNRAGIAELLDSYSLLAGLEQQGTRTARLGGAACALWEATGLRRSPFDQDRFDRQTTQVRETLGEAAFTAAFEEGRAMTAEQAVEYALHRSL